ncbi:MAG: FAD-binding protein [Saprospiraceae bacterium]|nr:FAD-binding protein [Saprospiraceae bacterium]
MAKAINQKKLVRKPWKNRHRNLEYKVVAEFDAHNRDENGLLPGTQPARFRNGYKVLQGKLAEIEAANIEYEQEGDPVHTVRAIGAAWSLSEVLANAGYVFNTKPLNLIVTDLREGDFEAGKFSNKYILAQCGASVKEINKRVEEVDLGLFTTGASDGQTIAGAISTGTHGAALQFGSMPDYVLGIHLVTASNQHFWIEGNEKTMSQSFLDEFMPGVQRMNDDEVFHAALVSFGSFGIVHGYLLACDDVYKLKVIKKFLPWDLVKECVNGPANIESLGLPPDPYHFEIDVFPYKMETVYVQAMYKEYGQAENRVPMPVEAKLSSGLDAIRLVGALNNFIGMSKELMDCDLIENQVMGQFKEKNGGYMAPRLEFGGSEDDRIEPAMSCELSFNANNALAALFQVLAVAQAKPFMGIVALRYIKQSKATLSFARFPTTVAMELPAVGSKRTKRFYERLWKELDERNFDFAFHWGQMNNIRAENMERRWRPEQVQAWKAARAVLLPTGEQRKLFSNAFLVAAGLQEDGG